MRPSSGSVRLGIAIALLVLCADARARACPTCTVGDPTLTTMGAEAPYRNRVRLSAGLSTRGDRVGTPGFDAIELREQRLDVTAAWAATERFVLSLNLPVAHRRLAYSDLSVDQLVTLGDAELRGRLVIHRDRRFAPRHLVSLLMGLEVPTAPSISKNGQQLPLELQAGSRSWDPLVGVAYDHFASPYSVHLVATLRVSTPGYEGAFAGPSGRIQGTFQWQAHERFGLRAGADMRGDAVTRTSSREREENTGGFIAFLTGGFVASLGDATLLNALVFVPVVQALRGQHREGVAALLSVTHDF
jgi:hypothetical protein